MTLRQLLEHIVRGQVAQFREMQADDQFLRVLTEQQFDAAAERGRITAGQSEVGIQAFRSHDRSRREWVDCANARVSVGAVLLAVSLSLLALGLASGVGEC